MEAHVDSFGYLFPNLGVLVILINLIDAALLKHPAHHDSVCDLFCPHPGVATLDTR